MGDFEIEPTMNITKKQVANRVSIVALLMSTLAFFAPVASSGYASGIDYFIIISAFFWALTISPHYFVFQFFNPITLMMMVPFLLFRIASVYQISRYYQGKTTKGRARIGAFIGDAPFLIVYMFIFITVGFYGGIGLNFPLPIMMIVGLLLLWKFPVHEATVPWEEEGEPTYWWENVSEDEPEPAADNQPW